MDAVAEPPFPNSARSTTMAEMIDDHATGLEPAGSNRHSKPGCLVVGVSLLTAWAGAICFWYLSSVIEGAADEALHPWRGLVGGLASMQSVLCGVALLVAWRTWSVRQIRGLRWIVVVGLALAWFVPIATALDVAR